MSTRNRPFYVLPAIGALLCGLALAFAAIPHLTGGAASPIWPAVAAVGGSFHLQDQNGSLVSDQDLKGRTFLVFFGFTHCPDLCPTILSQISEVMRRLGKDADRTSALFITVDPERDTPAILREYLSNFDPHLRGLTGERAAIDSAMKAYRIYAKKIPLDNGDYTMDHTAVVYLMDRNGHFIAPFNLNETPEAAAERLRGYL